jgi:hypothetical protein
VRGVDDGASRLTPHRAASGARSPSTCLREAGASLRRRQGGEPKRARLVEASLWGASIERPLRCHDLLEQLRSDRDFARERTAVSGDQEDGHGNARGKDRERDDAGEPVVAMNHGDGNEGAKPLEQDRGPFDHADRRLADNDALTPCVQCPPQLVDNLALRRLLALIGRIHRKGDLQAFDEVGRERCEGHLPLRHGAPFVRHRFIDMAIDDLAQLLPLVFRDALGEENDAAKGARFRRDSGLGPVKIVPDLNGDEAHEETEDDAERRQHSRRDGLEGAPPGIDSKSGHHEIDGRSGKIDGEKHKERHPRQRQIEKPVAHALQGRSSAGPSASRSMGAVPAISGGNWRVRVRCRPDLEICLERNL